FRAIKGTRDILPPETALWNWFEATARGVMEAYNFAEIRTPIFEETELFARSIGVETDVVNKEMYSVEDPSLTQMRELRDRLQNMSALDTDVQRAVISSQIMVLSALLLRNLLQEAVSDGEIVETENLKKVCETLDL